MGQPEPLVIDIDGLDLLIETLSTDGYRILGPVLRDDAIVYDDISAAADLPQGWTDRQEPGRYRVERRPDHALFGYVVGPHSWKRFLHPPLLTFEARKTDDGFVVESAPEEPRRLAFVGVRACELAAIAIQDRVFLEGPYVDPHYQRRREDNFLVAVNCTEAASTCFCVSMGTGPRAGAGFDLALTELVEADRHEFLLEVGSERGAEVAGRLSASKAGNHAVEAAVRALERTEQQITRVLETGDLPRILEQSYESPHWDRVAERCLACANCTMVCPTCFCTAVDDVTDLSGEASRVRRWDSCFNVDFSYIHGGAVRTSVAARYRQWFIHKLGTWHEQFGSSGCVGCGRCITWCPARIDITAEARALRERQSRTEASRGSEDA